MVRLYVGNLDSTVVEKDLQAVLEEKQLKADAVQLKEGYALLDCPDQNSADEVVSSLAGHLLKGLSLQVETSNKFKSSNNVASTPNTATPNTATRLAVKNFPPQVPKETVRELFTNYGELKDLHVTAEGTAIVTYMAPDMAQQAKEKLNEFEFQGAKLKIDYVHRKQGSHKTPGAIHNQEFPLRILVPFQYVGAIIGRGGQTIRTITTKTNARVDVVRRDNSISIDKQMVLILAAQAENCIEACKEILKVITSEMAEAANKGSEPPASDVELRILAHNNLCGRLIGRQGMVIKTIMSSTSTQITVSNVNNVNNVNPDRTVTIKGDLDNMCAAAEKVYVKLKSAFDADLSSMRYEQHAQVYYPGGHGGMVMGGGHQMNPWNYRNQHPMGNQLMNYPGGGGFNPGVFAQQQQQQQQQQSGPVTCFLFIPKASVGAVIGTRGSFINFVKSESKATCQVMEDPNSSDSTDRTVKITGFPESTWKAQWYIFDKIKAEGFAGAESLKLRVEIIVPRGMVGRIIGKGGVNVRDVQHISGAIIKLPDDPQSEQPEEVPVQIVGNIYSQTLAQALVRQLLTQGQISHPSLQQPRQGGNSSRLAHHHPRGGHQGGPAFHQHHHHGYHAGSSHHHPNPHHHHQHQHHHSEGKTNGEGN